MKSKRTLKIITIVILSLTLVIGLASCELFSGETLVTNTTDITESFENITIDTSVSDVYIQPSTNGRTSVVCRESEKVYHSVTVANGTLSISEVDTRSDMEKAKASLGILTKTIIIYLPIGEYDSLDVEIDTGNLAVPSGYTFKTAEIETDTGNVDYFSNANSLEIDTDTGIIKVRDITATIIKLQADKGDLSVKDATAENISLETDTGDISIFYSDVTSSIDVKTNTGEIQLTDISCANVNVSNDTGKTVLHSLIASETLNINSDVGEVKLIYSDAHDIVIETNVGSVHATLLSEKQFDVKTDIGKTNIPQSAGEGTCKITTGLGDITVIIEKILVVE